MPAFGIVEALDVVEHIGSRHVRSGTSRPVRSVFSDEYKLPIAALSQPLPERLTEQMTPVISHQSLILLGGVLGGFNRSSQHLEEEVAMNRRALCGAPLVGSTEHVGWLGTGLGRRFDRLCAFRTWRSNFGHGPSESVLFPRPLRSGEKEFRFRGPWHQASYCYIGVLQF